MTAPVSALSGLGLVDDARQIASGIQNGSWIDASLGGVGVSLEALSLVLDPLGSLVSWGVGWLLEHVSVLREALDHLAGNASAVSAQAAQWQQVSSAMASARQSYLAGIEADTTAWAGGAAEAYRTHAATQLTAMEGIGVAAGGIASAVEGTGLLVALVREIVRDLIADFVATLAVRLPQWLAMEGFSLGVATPLVASQVASLVAKWANRIQHFIRGLLSSLRRLLPMTDWLRKVLEKLRELMNDLARKLPGFHRADSSASPPPSGGGSAGGGGPSVPPPGPPWRGRDDIPGPARGKDLKPPHPRHSFAGIKHGQVRKENTFILRGNEAAVQDDVRQIADGNANFLKDTGDYEVNGRIYTVEPSGTVFPVSGPGLVPLNNNEYAALKEIARADGDVDAVKAFQHNPRFLNNPEAIAKAKSIYDGTYSE
ncbi:hypothetical protein FB565_000767 [Actinoplanes lutulentus]|uniref:WXG100 family type VII secretion target n=1 Tax=Actinoplanes lutulentus TaxID=1287878 RepID=A0A327ZKM4_9ACTN|nr:hypothetical protein [Actinoplanes lutulentus]MBB2941063.1 hypothetical protein [Actinoplanes lutulentus]RAK43372.1 hypothetical protein B0I29_101502 [Actinoplanes lutulentus]